MDYKNLEMLTWLVGQFRRAGNVGITFGELLDRLYEGPVKDKILTKRTFHNYLKELRDRFGVKIECDKRLQFEVGRKGLSEENRRYRYRLVDEPQSDKVSWAMPFLAAFETSAVMKQLQESEGDRRFMYIDNKPSGVENMNILLDAIRQQKCVDLYYHDPKNRFPYFQEDFEPRGLVQKDYVWYVLGHTNYHMERIWPLNRLTDIRIKDTMYRTDHGFDSERFWKAHKKLWMEYFS